MPDAAVLERKVTIRKQAFRLRKEARSDTANQRAVDALDTYLATIPSDHIISGYMAIQTEADPALALKRACSRGQQVCLPVIQGRGFPLLFRSWTPDTPMIEGDFGALIPRSGGDVVPQVLIVPLVAFDATGSRMGYGGGFYDRTLAKLRADGDVTAVGFAFAGQRQEMLPIEPTDQRLDAIITEEGLHWFAPSQTTA